MTNALKVALVGIGKIASDQHVPSIRASDDWELSATVSRNGSVDGVDSFRDMETMLAARAGGHQITPAQWKSQRLGSRHWAADTRRSFASLRHLPPCWPALPLAPSPSNCPPRRALGAAPRRGR